MAVFYVENDYPITRELILGKKYSLHLLNSTRKSVHSFER